MGRFSDIYRGGEYKLALDNLNKYRADALTRQSPRITGTGTPKNRIQTKLAIISFEPSVRGKDMTHVLVRASKDSVDNTDNFAKTTLAKYYSEAKSVTAGKLQSPVKKFAPARALVFSPEAASVGKYEKSKYTGLYYIKRPGKGYSLPIGRKASTDTTSEGEVKAEIRGELQPTLDLTAYRRLSFTEEKIPD